MEMFGENEPTYIPLSEYFEEIRMGPFGSLLHKFDYIEGGIPLINPTHISAGEILPDLNFSITQSKAKELEIYRLRSGDLIIGRRGEMGRCAVVKDEHDGFLCGTGSMILRAARGKIDPFFLSELIRSRKVVERIEAVASGVTMMNLNSKSFDRVMVPKISLDQQKEYFRRVEYLAILRPSMEIGLSNLVSLFASLQHRAFRGEL
jgi:type I restriction enzyme S subunit